MIGRPQRATRSMPKSSVLPISVLCIAVPVLAQTPAPGGTYAVRLLPPEVALKAVLAAPAEWRKRGYQVAVAAVDRAGVPQALLRDRFAGPHTPRTAIDKAWTAVSFRVDTLALAQQTQPGQPGSGIRHLPHVVTRASRPFATTSTSGAPRAESDGADAANTRRTHGLRFGASRWCGGPRHDRLHVLAAAARKVRGCARRLTAAVEGHA
ncbi:MAG TPA: heme-binding protein [Burkholderiaceae bacterium]|nr:heme-binding protein [Burkholderiaceae bacterium]